MISMRHYRSRFGRVKNPNEPPVGHTVLALDGLPPHHKDPFDRLLIAQARSEGWNIVSKDSAFEAYGVTVIW
jgi:PIN domain nuclease of toxin-antitoxin system